MAFKRRAESGLKYRLAISLGYTNFYPVTYISVNVIKKIKNNHKPIL